MPTSTWATMRDEILRPLGFEDFATTTNIPGGGTAVISTELANRWSNNDFFNGWYFILEQDSDGGTPANGAGLTRRVTDYVASTGTLTVAGAGLSTEDEAVDCAVSRFHPDDVKRAFNRARQDVWPHVGIVRDHQTLVTGPGQTLFTVPSTIRSIRGVQIGSRLRAASVSDNLLTDGEMEDWVSTTELNKWAVTGSGSTVNQESQATTPTNHMVLEGQYSARLAVDVSTETTLLHDYVTPDVAIGSVELNGSIWVYCTEADRVKAQITTTGPSTTQGSYHSGTGWERLTASKTPSSATTQCKLGIHAHSSGPAVSAYVDEAILIAGPSEALEGTWEPVIDPYEHIPAVAGASNHGLLRLPRGLPEKQVLRIIGTDLLSSVSTDSDTVEVDGELLEPLYAKVREYLCAERNKSSAWADREENYRAEYEELINFQGRRLRMPNRKLRMVAV